MLTRNCTYRVETLLQYEEEYKFLFLFHVLFTGRRIRRRGRHNIKLVSFFVMKYIYVICRLGGPYAEKL